jgi:GWxTD domain-containing protein
MRFNKIFLLLFLLMPLAGRALPDISMEVCRYQVANVPFVEVSIYVAGPSLLCKGDATKTYGIGYVLMIKDSSGHVLAGDRYRLTAAGCPAKDIIDVRRFNLQSGIYSVEMEAYDIADSISLVNTTQHLKIEADLSKVFISDLNLAATIKEEQVSSISLNKSGMYVEPLPFRFYYPALNMLHLYFETYHIDQLAGQPYLQYTIRPAKGEIPAPVQSYKKLKKDSVSAHVFQLDISSLISGQYILEVNVFDGEKQERARAVTSFSRLNPVGDSIFMESGIIDFKNAFVKSLPADSLDYFMRAMAPIVNSLEVDAMNILLREGTEQTKRYFIYRYWTNVADKLAGPAFSEYMKVARVIDFEYNAGFGYGFETDRGHAYLKYGKPDEIIAEEAEPSAPPYEIWFYTTFPATHQQNVRFLFYNPSLAHNAYSLLHSTARGEVYNPLWEKELYRDATLEALGVNDKEMPENVYRKAREYFEN